MARMTIAEVTAEVMRKWCGSDAERKPPIPPAQASASAPLPRRARACAETWAPGAKPADRIDPGSGAALTSSRHDALATGVLSAPTPSSFAFVKPVSFKICLLFLVGYGWDQDRTACAGLVLVPVALGG